MSSHIISNCLEIVAFM
jgi:hypothetical protein